MPTPYVTVSIRNIVHALDNDQFDFLCASAARIRINCESIAEYLTELVRDQYEESKGQNPMTKTKDPICRSFRQDFPQFVERALALGVNISLGEGRRNGRERVFWLDGYKQLTGYTTRSDGSPFTLDDASRNIDTALTAIEEDRAAVATLSVPQRFLRVIDEFRKMKPQYRMIGEVRQPNGEYRQLGRPPSARDHLCRMHTLRKGLDRCRTCRHPAL
jgi:hypothetical protein